MELPEITEEQWQARTAHALRIREYARYVAIAGKDDLMDTYLYNDELVSIYYSRLTGVMSVDLLLNDDRKKEVFLARGKSIKFFNPYPIEWCKHIVEHGKAGKLSIEAEAKAKEERDRREMLMKWGFLEGAE